MLFAWFSVEVIRLGWRLRARFADDFACGYVNAMLAAWVSALILMVFADWILPHVYNIGFRGFQASVWFGFSWAVWLPWNKCRPARLVSHRPMTCDTTEALADCRRLPIDNAGPAPLRSHRQLEYTCHCWRSASTPSLQIVNRSSSQRPRRPCGSQRSQPSIEVFVIDNASSDGSVQMLKERFPWVRLIENTENLGFARANNQAIDLANGRYILLLNSDTVVHPGAFAALTGFMEHTPQAGAAGAYLLNEDGTLQLACSSRC